jgi:hypothetical protein
MLDSDPTAEIEIILKLILRFASSQFKAGVPGWDVTLASIFSYMTEGPHNTDISPYTSQFAEDFRSLFLEYFANIQDLVLGCKAALSDQALKLPNSALLDELVWPTLLKRIKFWVSSVFYNSSSSSRDGKKDFKKLIVDFSNSLIGSFISLQQKQSYFEELIDDSKCFNDDQISFVDYCKM